MRAHNTALSVPKYPIYNTSHTSYITPAPNNTYGVLPKMTPSHAVTSLSPVYTHQSGLV